jgi:hypothetical protein
LRRVVTVTSCRRCRSGGKDVTLGIFDNEIDAAVEYDKALRNWFPARLVSSTDLK